MMGFTTSTNDVGDLVGLSEDNAVGSSDGDSFGGDVGVCTGISLGDSDEDVVGDSVGEFDCI